MFESWRGVVGDIKPTHRPGSLEEFIKLLPDGIGVIPLTVGISSGTEQEFHDVLEDYKQKAAQLAGLGVDLISIGGAPPMMVHGFHGEEGIVKDLEAKHGVPVSTSGRSTVAAMTALGIKKFVGVTYFPDRMNEIFSRYFTEEGFRGGPVMPDAYNGSPKRDFKSKRWKALKCHSKMSADYLAKRFTSTPKRRFSNTPTRTRSTCSVRVGAC